MGEEETVFSSGCPSWFYLNLAQASTIPEERVSVEEMLPHTHKTGLQASLRSTKSRGITVANLVMCFREDCGGF